MSCLLYHNSCFSMVQGKTAKGMVAVYQNPLKSMPDDTIPAKYIYSPSNSEAKADISSKETNKVRKSLYIA